MEVNAKESVFGLVARDAVNLRSDHNHECSLLYHIRSALQNILLSDYLYELLLEHLNLLGQVNTLRKAYRFSVPNIKAPSLQVRCVHVRVRSYPVPSSSHYFVATLESYSNPRLPTCRQLL